MDVKWTSITGDYGVLERIPQGTHSNMQYEYLWLVKNLPKCYKNSGINDLHHSSPLFVGLNNEYEWTLDLYVAGYDRENADYVGICVFLRHQEKHKDKTFLVEISLLTKDDQIKQTRKIMLTHENINKCGGMFKDFILRRDLWNKPEYLTDDDLKLAVKICVGESSISDEAYALQCTYESSQRTLEKLWECRQFTDFKIIIGKREFPVHQAILAAASPVFQAMFENNMHEATVGEVIIKDVEASVMEKVLHFIYVNKLNDTENMINKILTVAEKYQLDSLKHLCENILVKQLNVDNVYDILLLADQNSAEELKKETIEFFLQNAKKLSTTATNFKASIETLPVNLQTEIICAFVANL